METTTTTAHVHATLEVHPQAGPAAQLPAFDGPEGTTVLGLAYGVGTEYVIAQLPCGCYVINGYSGPVRFSLNGEALPNLDQAVSAVREQIIAEVTAEVDPASGQLDADVLADIEDVVNEAFAR